MPSAVTRQKRDQAAPEAQGDGLQTRQHAIRMEPDGRPSTFDREARTVELILATEEPVPVYDWEYGSIGEVLLMSGLKLPASRQVPLQDTHDRYTVRSTVGSVRNIRVEGDQVVGTAHFSRVADAEDAMTKVEEGHITDFSVGWRQLKAVRIPKNESQIIAGRTFTGPLRVVTSWAIKEESIVPIGADERAKARSAGAAYQDTEEKSMNEKLRKALEALGLRTGATDDEAWHFFELLGGKREDGEDAALGFLAQRGTVELQPPHQAAPGQARAGEPGQAGAGAQGAGDVTAAAQEAARAAAQEAVRAENKRAADIRSLCAAHGCGELADNLIGGGKTLDEARAAVLDHMARERSTGNLQIPGGSFSFGADAGEKFRSAAIDSLLVRGGQRVETPAPGHDELMGYQLRELARECLRRANQRTGGHVLDMVGRALTASDLPNILADVANKSLILGFETAEETFELWTVAVPANDFRRMTLAGISDIDGLLPIGEDGEYQYGYAADKAEFIQLGTFGRIYPITRTAIINDDLFALTTIPARRGAAAKRVEGDAVYAVLTNNAAMNETGQNLFSAAPAGHGNIPGAAQTISTAGMNAMMALVAGMRGINGEALNINIKYLVAPKALWGTGEEFYKSMYTGTQANPTKRNIYENAHERVYEPRLDVANPAIWYLMGPKGKTVVRAHLNGVSTPYLETKVGWNIDGVEYKVRYDVAAAAPDFRGMYRNT